MFSQNNAKMTKLTSPLTKSAKFKLDGFSDVVRDCAGAAGRPEILMIMMLVRVDMVMAVVVKMAMVVVVMMVVDMVMVRMMSDLSQP